jgi:hypothetical protein
VISVQAYASLNSVWVSKWVGIKDIPPGAWKACRSSRRRNTFAGTGLLSRSLRVHGNRGRRRSGGPARYLLARRGSLRKVAANVGPDGGLIFNSTTGAGGSQSTGASRALPTPRWLDPNAVDDTPSTAGCACEAPRADRQSTAAAVFMAPRSCAACRALWREHQHGLERAGIA